MRQKMFFYQQRDLRSQEYGVVDAIFNQPVAISIGPDVITSERGQIALFALVNMVCRIHRNLQISIPDGPILAHNSFYHIGKQKSLKDAIYTFAKAIDPYIDISWKIYDSFQAGIGLGNSCNKMPWYIGFDAGMTWLDLEPQPIDVHGGFSLGACMCACLASSTLIKQLLGLHIRPIKLSAWNLRENDNALSGPKFFEPLEVGDVAVIGAGGVGSCLLYWLRQSGYMGQWMVIDADKAELHNTNRSLGILPIDTGWPDTQQKHKAQLAAKLVNADYHNQWYSKVVEKTASADLILPLANEHDARACIAQRGEQILLHATTSENWEAQLHRHVAGRDDCIVCRMPQSGRLKCSTVKINKNSPSSDAALPFLSATAGLLLLNGLYRLMHGELIQEESNCWRVLFNSNHQVMKCGKFKCSANCDVILPDNLRKKLNIGKCWGNL